MKKLISVMLVFMTLIFPVCAVSEDGYELDDFQEIEISENQVDYYVHAIHVDVSWAAVFRDYTIHTFIIASKPIDNIFDVVITDGYFYVHGDFKLLGHYTLDVTFMTEKMRWFNAADGVYLLLFYKNDGLIL